MVLDHDRIGGNSRVVFRLPEVELRLILAW